MQRTLTTAWALRRTSRRRSANIAVDNLVFALSGVAALWLAWLLLSVTFTVGWYMVPWFVLFWLVLAYLVLPRIHRILTAIYVPDYFIGRARTSDGLLGDPINLAAAGTEGQLHAAMTNAGWIRADEVTLRSSAKIITATVFRHSYDEAPVSPLLLFGRQQDLAYQQEVAGNPARRHHVRFWHSPEGWMLPGGHRVDWLAAGTFDRAVGFSLFTLQITHKIAANTDIERDHIVKTLTGGGQNVSVRTIEDFATGYHARNGGGDTIETDGDLPIVDVGKVPAIELPGGRGWRARLAEREGRRPVSTMFGVLLMGVRIVVGIVTVVRVAGEWDMAVAVAAAGFPAYLLLAVLVFRGSNWARIASMAFSGALVLLAAVDFFNGRNVTLRENLFGLPLDILVLLALSAEAASTWARARPDRRGDQPRSAGD